MLKVIAINIHMIYIIYMVTVLQVDSLKYKINQNDHNPPHVHVEGGGASVRINLRTLEVMDSKTEFSERMVNKIVEYVSQNQMLFIEKWGDLHEEKK